MSEIETERERERERERDRQREREREKALISLPHSSLLIADGEGFRLKNLSDDIILRLMLNDMKLRNTKQERIISNNSSYQ